jgi:predicted TIM-barrel fold metal-dependent hydrolase
VSHRQPEEVRAQLDHPVIDSDGHLLEFMPAVRELFIEEAGPDRAADFDMTMDIWKVTQGLDPAAKRNAGLFRMTWWGFPAANTLDRATATLPRLMYDRMDEFGLDFGVVYPTYGLGPMSHPDEEMRRAATRAYNRYFAEVFSGLGERLTPVATIPMHTPEEAIEELEHCTRNLGFKAAVLAGSVKRPLPPNSGSSPSDVPPAAAWLDTFGLDSAHDYDPVWAKCIELGISPTFHSSGMGQPTRASLSSYVFNHIGNFAAAGEGTCRSLFLGGVTRRFPGLRFAFLEGGVGWAANLFSDLLGHWEKRGLHHIRHYDPNAIDRARMRELFDRYADPRSRNHSDELDRALGILSDPDEDDAMLDEFAACEIESPEDLRDLFAIPFSFGCEADDPMNARAFDTRANPLGTKFKAIFSSDIGHWDVPDMRGVLGEAWELVEHGHIDAGDFREFVFENAIDLWCGTNPDFFEGTRVAEAVRKHPRPVTP